MRFRMDSVGDVDVGGAVGDVDVGGAVEWAGLGASTSAAQSSAAAIGGIQAIMLRVVLFYVEPQPGRARPLGEGARQRPFRHGYAETNRPIHAVWGSAVGSTGCAGRGGKGTYITFRIGPRAGGRVVRV